MMELVVWASGIAAISAALGALAKWVVRPAWRFFRSIQEFLEDWNGEPGRPGVRPRPGVMERLERIEWHVGNGSPIPLRQVVDETKRDLGAHLQWADEQVRTFAATSRGVNLGGEVWAGDNDDDEIKP